VRDGNYYAFWPYFIRGGTGSFGVVDMRVGRFSGV